MKKLRHHAARLKHAATRVRHTAKRVRPWVWIVLGAIVLVPCFAGLFYVQERYDVRGQNISDPVACRSLLYTSNVQECEQMLLSAYSKKHGLEREPICDRGKDRSRFGNASMLCDKYDDALTGTLHNSSLQEFGISVWEPDETLQLRGSLRARSIELAQSIYLVCSGVIVPSTFLQERGETVVSYQGTPSGPCVLIATTSQGSITSEEFYIGNRT